MFTESARDRGDAGCGQARDIAFMVGKAWRLIAVMVLAAMLYGAVAPSPSEYQIKAAFLYNFTKFVEWPAKAFRATSRSMTLCILGEDPFGTDLEQILDGKMVNGKSIAIKRFSGMRGLEVCHILFISSSERSHLPEILEALREASMLTVGETERFAKLGGIINFTIEENKVRFEINVDAAERAGLKISSRLLKLGKVIRDRSTREKD
jgi:hypothetical protein